MPRSRRRLFGLSRCLRALAVPPVVPGSAIIALLGVLLLAACTPSRITVTPGLVSAPVPDDRAPLDWARDEEIFVVVRRTCRTVSLYRRGEWLRTYEHASFGRENGTKLYEGDRRTPSGLYEIVGHRHHPRWSRFLLLDYPNLKDKAAHRQAYEAGDAPANPGGQVGIHGSDEPRLNELGVDWTFGCISLLNRDVQEMYDLVPDGTLVLIED